MARVFVDDAGAVWRLPVGTTTPVAVALPAGVSAVANRAVQGKVYRDRLYMVGPWNRALVFTEDYKLWGMGIMPPPSAPVIAASGSGGANTASLTTYFTFREKTPAGKLIAESNPGPASNTLTDLTDAGIAVSSVPTTAPEARVTHVGYYRTDGGALPRLAAEIPIGPASFIDLISTVSLATRESIPNREDSVTLERGVPPDAKIIGSYHDRMWFAGVSAYPNRLYYGKLFEPEAVGALNYLTTHDGEPITALEKSGDTLLVFCRRACYAVQGWSGDDFRMEKVSPSIGCISALSAVNINERVWFAAEQGIYVYDGGFHFVMEGVKSDWRSRYIADPSIFDRAFGADDQEFHCYKLLIPYTGGAYYYVGNYEQFDPSLAEEGSAIRWTIDTRTRYDRCQGRMVEPNTTRLKLYTGSDDGKVREENYSADSSDNSDAAAIALEIRTKHFYFDDPGGDTEEAKNLIRAWSYVKGESNAWAFRPLGGDEETNSSAWTSGWSDSVAASASGGYVARTRHFHPIPEKVHGHGFTFVYTVTSPTGWVFRGIGGVVGLGTSFRGPSS